MQFFDVVVLTICVKLINFSFPVFPLTVFRLFILRWFGFCKRRRENLTFQYMKFTSLVGKLQIPTSHKKTLHVDTTQMPNFVIKITEKNFCLLWEYVDKTEVSN